MQFKVGKFYFPEGFSSADIADKLSMSSPECKRKWLTGDGAAVLESKSAA